MLHTIIDCITDKQVGHPLGIGILDMTGPDCNISYLWPFGQRPVYNKEEKSWRIARLSEKMLKKLATFIPQTYSRLLPTALIPM